MPINNLTSKHRQSVLPKPKNVCWEELNRKNRFKIKNFPKAVFDG